MKEVRAELSKEFKILELHTFADLHIRDAHCDYKAIHDRIEHVRNTPNAYCVLNGDILNNATKTSVSDMYGELLTPMQQVMQGVSLFAPIKDKILAVTTGNHEYRTYKKEGICLSCEYCEDDDEALYCLAETCIKEKVRDNEVRTWRSISQTGRERR